MSHHPRDVDILLVSDLRFPGGTSHSIATEIQAQHEAGYRTGLVHLNGPLVRRVSPVNPIIARLVRDSTAALLVGPEPITTRVVVFRHPGVLQEAADQLPAIECAQAVILANSGPEDARGNTVYDVAKVDRMVREHLGVDPLWAPIGPLVRHEIETQAPVGRMMATDWVNVIDVEAWAATRDGWAADRPVIGRHSRPSAQKWPSDRETLTAVYPVDGSWEVRVLGGAGPVERLLGRVPRQWQILDFGAMSPRDFLAGLDFFVYYHDPRWVEAFGRTILEAIASGVVAVLPPHFERLFGEAALYAEPAEVRSLVESLRADRDEYLAQAARATQVAKVRFSYETHARRIHDLIGPPTEPSPQLAIGGSPTPAAERPAPRSAPVRTGQMGGSRSGAGPRVLLMSSNGAGMGHLTRLFSYATRLGAEANPAVLSLSQAVPLAGRLGLPFEYLPSARALSMPPGRWQPIFVSRVSETLDRFDPDVVVFDGTWPYTGIEQIRAAHPRSRWVWSRRGMWRAGQNTAQIDKAAWFDEVLEPGDLAARYDSGATVDEAAYRVGPVTLVDRQDLQDRATARTVLGLPADGPQALVSLGAGNINDTRDDVGAAIASLGTLGVGICVTVPDIASAGAAAGEEIHLVRDYPLSAHYAAFDVIISASGYNSFHELLRLGVPTLFVPNTSTSLDDQEARARFAADQGWAHQLSHLSVRTATPLLEDLLTNGRQMAAGAQAADPGNGAQSAADFLTRLAIDGAGRAGR